MTNDFSAYLTPGERILWQGHNNIGTKQGSLLRSMVPALLGMAVALAVAYYLVFVLSPGSVLNIGFGIDSKLSMFLIVLLVFAPFLIRPLWQRRQSKSILLLGVKVPLVEAALILTGMVLLAVGLSEGVPLPILLLVLVIVPALSMAESPQEQPANYVVTNLSGLIVPAGASHGKRVTIVPFMNLTEIQVVENRDGTGSLLFGAQTNALRSARASSVPAFWNIEQPWDVYHLIRTQMANGQPPETNC